MMNAIQFVHSSIRTSAFTVRRASRRLTREEFFASQKDTEISMAWTLLHLTGQLEWAVKMTNGHNSIHEPNFLDQAKGERSGESRGASTVNTVDRGRLETMFEESADRALNVLDCAEDKWNSEPTDRKAILVFPSVAAVWKHVAFHFPWHLGQLSILYPQLLVTEYTEPPLRGYIGELN